MLRFFVVVRLHFHVHSERMVIIKRKKILCRGSENMLFRVPMQLACLTRCYPPHLLFSRPGPSRLTKPKRTADKTEHELPGLKLVSPC